MTRRKIAVGIFKPTDEIVDYLWAAQGYADITVVGSKIPGLNCIETKDDEEASRVICELAHTKKVDGFCRAQLKDSYTHKVWREMTGKGESDKKPFISFFAKDDRWSAAVAVSNYNALDLESKRFEIDEGIKFLENELGIKPKIAILSTRRLTGRVGEFGLNEEIAQRCATIAEELKKRGYEVHDEYYINYEQAIKEECTLICPSIGMIGNTWAKALVYTGGWEWVFTPYLHEGGYYDSTPRNNTNFFWAVVSCAAWVNRGKGNN